MSQIQDARSDPYHYGVIGRAIETIAARREENLSLEEVAAGVGLILARPIAAAACYRTADSLGDPTVLRLFKLALAEIQADLRVNRSRRRGIGGYGNLMMTGSHSQFVNRKI